jgi:hypothetical protein
MIDHALLFIKPESMVSGTAFCRATMQCPQATDSLRLRAAELLMRYECLPPDRRISTPIDLPAPTTAEIANRNIATLVERMQKGEMGLSEGTMLVQAQNAAIASLEGSVLAADFTVVERVIAANPPVARAVVVGGLGGLPGNATMLLPDTSEPVNPGPWTPPEGEK